MHESSANRRVWGWAEGQEHTVVLKVIALSQLTRECRWTVSKTEPWMNGRTREGERGSKKKKKKTEEEKKRKNQENVSLNYESRTF